MAENTFSRSDDAREFDPDARPTRRRLCKCLIVFSACLLSGRAKTQDIPTPRTKRKEVRAKSSAPTATAKKAWLTLPSTPTLPTTERSDLLSINGTKIFFAQFGEGPPIVLLHGGFGNSNYWGNQVRELANKFTVIVLDTRGHGRSPVMSNKFGFATFAEDVAGLLENLGIANTAIVGWSDGAITGLQLAMTRPHLVSKLFAFGANSTAGGLRPGGSKSPVFAAYAARCKSEYAKLSPEPERWPQLVKGLGAMWRREPNFTTTKLATITAKTAISDGEHDEIIRRADTESMARAIPGAKLVMLPGVSHFAMLQDPAQFNRALMEFLSD